MDRPDRRKDISKGILYRLHWAAAHVLAAGVMAALLAADACTAVFGAVCSGDPLPARLMGG